MVAFRKVFPVLAGFALLIGAQSAFGQVATGTPLSCNANAGVPPVLRAEGFTELTGDLVVTCTGGNPAAPFLANFQLFLNTNITSRITADPVTEALLMIDEPGLPRTDVNGAPSASTTPYCVSPNSGTNPTVASFINPAGVVTTQVPGLTATTTNTGFCNNALSGGGPGNQTFQQGTFTVFRGIRQTVNTENTLVWPGVPVVPPGSNRSRTFRITNVRANAAGLGASQTLIPTQVVAYISVFPQGTLPIDNPQQTVGYVQQGLLFDVRSCTGGGRPSGATSAFQCRGVSQDRFNDPTSGNLPSNSATTTQIFGLRYREGFQTAFKPRIVNNTGVACGTAGAALGVNTGVASQECSQPGQVFNSESGFVNPATTNAGIADSGTRLAARFQNIPANVRIFVTTTSVGSGASTPGSFATLVSTDPNGSSGVAGLFPTGVTQLPLAGVTNIVCAPTTTPAAEVVITNGSGLAVWEVTSSDPSVNETLVFQMAYAFRANAAAGQPALGTAQIIGNFAPFYTQSNAGSASSLLPIPRFAPSTTTSTLFTITACQTNLLFPYVTNFAGFDTGIAIANTSQDPFSSANANNGRCKINYYGVLANGNPPTTTSETTDREIAAGQTLTFILSGGGTFGLKGNPNFQGYIIAQCDFLFAHGFAFITDGPIGQARVAEGYLALVLDGDQTVNDGLRGNTFGENRGH